MREVEGSQEEIVRIMETKGEDWASAKRGCAEFNAREKRMR